MDMMGKKRKTERDPKRNPPPGDEQENFISDSTWTLYI